MTTSTENVGEIMKRLQEMAGNSDHEDVSQYRQQLSKIIKQTGNLLSSTSEKEHNYDVAKLKQYVQFILSEAWACRNVGLDVYEEFTDAQKLNRFSAIIHECVERSNFTEKNLRGLEGVSVQRADIAKAKSLRELRSACKAMSGPLSVARKLAQLQEEYTELYECSIASSDLDAALVKLNEAETSNEELRRVLNEVCALYDPKAEGKDLLLQIEEYKETHKCSDDEACKPFGISRSKLVRMRKDFK